MSTPTDAGGATTPPPPGGVEERVRTSCAVSSEHQESLRNKERDSWRVESVADWAASIRRRVVEVSPRIQDDERAFVALVHMQTELVEGLALELAWHLMAMLSLVVRYFEDRDGTMRGNDAAGSDLAGPHPGAGG